MINKNDPYDFTPSSIYAGLHAHHPQSDDWHWVEIYTKDHKKIEQYFRWINQYCDFDECVYGYMWVTNEQKRHIGPQYGFRFKHIEKAMAFKLKWLN